VNDQWSSETIWILALVMGMIPVGSRLVNLGAVEANSSQEEGLKTHCEVVGELASWGYTALANLSWSVHFYDGEVVSI